MKKHISYTMENLVPIMLEFFEEGKKVIITATGNSMEPLIRNGKDCIVLAPYKGEKLSEGDAVFYKRNNGRYVLHRIIEVSSDGIFSTLGDNQKNFIEKILPSQVIAFPVALIRNGKELSLESGFYRAYKKLWGKNSLFRTVHIKLFSLKIKLSRFLKNKQKNTV